LIFVHKVLNITTPVVETTSHGSMTHAFLISPSELIQLILFRFRLTIGSTYNRVFRMYPVHKSASTFA